MKPRRTALTGAIAGPGMGVALLLAGAVAARIVYGPQMTPEGEFRPE